MSPWATAWGSILIARIRPRPSAVACTMPPPAEADTVCCASCDWISDSRNCICCPSWSRLDKSAIRRKRSEEHTSELQSRLHLVCRLLLEKKKKNKLTTTNET